VSSEPGAGQALTSDLATELQNRKPNNRIKIASGQGFSLQFSGNPPVAHIAMHPIAWLVSVGTAQAIVEEEAKWLIDVAISYLRLQIKVEGRRFPRLGEIEPHPIRPEQIDNVGVKIKGSSAFVGGASVPPVYEITEEVKALTVDSSFCAKASIIFDPPSKSLAARASQGLGWLTRGRQAEDRAERLLYFFTAIESLLSNDDKTAPIIQTISRHASVLLTDDVKERVGVSAEIKKLYNLRSALVHTGNRGVLWDAANATQFLAEAIFSRVLETTDLNLSHSRFCEQLATASFGSPWAATE
jgi:Apea-like HEPN